MTLTLIFIALAAACNGVMDILQFKWDVSIFKQYPKTFKETFWNPKVSWINKWGDIVGEEKFWGSSRWFVFLTDAWHLFQFLMITFFALALQTAIFVTEPLEWIWWVVGLITQVIVHGVWGLSFTLFYDILLRKK